LEIFSVFYNYVISFIVHKTAYQKIITILSFTPWLPTFKVLVT